MKIGLLLEGGGLRGIYTAGVLDTFLEQKIEVHGIVSVSAGALFGVNYVSRQHGRAIRYNLKYLGDERYMGFKSLIKTGNIVNKDFAYYQLPFTLDPFDQETFGKSDIEFFATLTNLKTGEAEYIKIENVFEQMETLRATSALPMLSEIIKVDGKEYLDGGIADAIPIEKIMSMGFDKVIVILTRPLEYRKKSKLYFIQKALYRKYPNFLESWKVRSDSYNQKLEKIMELEREGKVFVFRPSETIKVKRIENDASRVQKMYNLGRKNAREKMDKLKEYLNIKE